MVLAMLLVPGFSAAAQSDGERIYQVLVEQNLLEDYFRDDMAEMVGNLVSAAGRWPGYGVNAPYRPGHVNVYLIDGLRLPKRNVLEAFDIPLDDRFAGNAMAHEATGILFVDTVLLKSLVTAAVIATNTELDTMAAVGLINARGIGALADIWDPKRNPALLQAEYLDHWVLMSSGAAAFVLAHEMGHLALGEQQVNKRRRPMRFASPADRDMHWACPDMVQEKYAAQQRIEQAADDYAVEVLSKVLFPPGVLNEPKLRYEVGAEWYIVYSMGQQMVQVLYATESDNIRAMLRVQFGPEVFAALDAKKREPGRGSVQVWFPETHPANIRRAAVSLARLAQSPYSISGGGTSGSQSSMAMFELLLQTECRNLEARRGTR
jgi:hypothetical protein